MKILLGVPEYPPHHIGGGGEVFKNLAENYKKLGHEVVVVYGYYPTKSWRENIKEYTDENGIKFYQIPEIPYPKSMPFLRTVMPCNLRAYFKLKKIIEKEKPDVAHLHGYGHLFIDILAMACNQMGLKFVFTNHGYPKIPYTKNSVVIFAWKTYKVMLGEKINKNAYKITCVSEFVKSEYNNAFSHKIFVIPNGIKTGYKGCAKRAIRNLKGSLNIQNEKILLSVGRITKYKGFQDVIEVLNQVQNIKYLIVGEEQDYQKQLEGIIKSRHLEDKVIFIGKIDKTKIHMYYQLSDVIVVPSQVESFGLVGLEALINMRCVISSGTQGLVYLRDSCNVYEYRNRNSLIELINKRLVYTPEDFCERFKWEKVTRLYLNNF